MFLTELLKPDKTDVCVDFHVTNGFVGSKQIVQEPGPMPVRWNLKVTHIGEATFGIETGFDMSSLRIWIGKADAGDSIGSLKNRGKCHSVCSLIRNQQAIELVTLDAIERHHHPGG